jgi:hypothetical protein
MGRPAVPVSASERLWRETTNRLARETSARVSGTYLAYAEGRLSYDEAVGIQATLIASAQRRSVTANDAILAADLTRRLETEHGIVGLQWMETPEQQAARLSKAVTSVIQDDIAYLEAAAKGKTPEQVKQLQAHSVRQRLDRLTTGEVADASQWSRQEGMRVWEEQGAIAGWYRGLQPTACEFCRTLAGPGDPAAFVHPVQHRMATHPGCTCVQVWVNEIEPWQKFLGPNAQMRDLTVFDIPVDGRPGWVRDFDAARARLPADHSLIGKNRFGNWDTAGPGGGPGPEALAHLDALMDAGKALDDELQKRIAARAAARKGDESLRREMDELTQKIKKLQASAADEYDRIWEREFAAVKQRSALAEFDDMTLDDFILLATDTGEAPTSLAQRIARGIGAGIRYEASKRTSRYGKLKRAISAAQEQRNTLANQYTGRAGAETTAAYAANLREEAIRLLSEVRDMGGQLTYLSGKGKVIKSGETLKSMRFAEEAYPADWLARHEGYLSEQAVVKLRAARYEGNYGIAVGSAKRGWNRGGYEIRLSTGTGRGHQPTGDTRGQFQVATHELGHSFEHSIDGLRPLEWMLSHKRSPRAGPGAEKRTSIYAGEYGYKDQWQNHYTGKVYKDSPEESWEIFTTGIESLMSGSPFMNTPDGTAIDAEFRHWLLGVLSVL